MQKTNRTPRQGVCTTYIGHRRLPGLPKEWGHKVPLPPIQILEAQAKLVGLASLRAPDGNSARKEENEKRPQGETSLSRNWSHFFIFQVHFNTFSYTFRHKCKTQSHAGSAALTYI